MSSAGDPSLPPIRVKLPDGQDVVGRLHERRCWPRGGWMYLVGWLVWATDSETEQVEAREFRMWLPPDKVERPDGVSYDDVPTYPLPSDDQEPAPASDRWAWKIQRVRPRAGHPGRVVVHIWDCDDAPAGGDELDVHEALDVLRTVAGAVACKECGCAVALGPLLDPT